MSSEKTIVDNKKHGGPTGMVPISTCRFCGGKVRWLHTKKGKPIPVNADTVKDPTSRVFDKWCGHRAHYSDCKEAQAARVEMNLPSVGEEV